MPWLPGIVLARAGWHSRPRLDVAVETASRAAVDAPLGFGTLQAACPIGQGARTGLAGIGFFDQDDGDPRRFGLVGDVLALASMRPQANLLLALGVQALAIGHVAHIANDQRADLPFLRPGDDGAADFVFHVPRAALLFGQKAILATLQATQGARAIALARLLRAQLGEPFGRVLLIGTQRPAGDNDRFLAIGEGGWMNLAQVDRRRVRSRRSGCGSSAIFHHQMPAVVPCRSVPHQSRFQKGRVQAGRAGGMAGEPQLEPALVPVPSSSVPACRRIPLGLFQIVVRQRFR